MTINIATLGRAVEAGFYRALPNYTAENLKKLSRQIMVPRRDTVRIYGIGDLGVPAWDAPAVEFERFGAFHVDIASLHNLDKGIEFTDEDLVRLPELMAKAAELPALFERAREDRLMTMILEGDATTYGTPFGASAIAYFSGTGAGHTYPGDVTYKTAMLNLLQAAEVTALDITTATAPTVTEWQTALPGVVNYIRANIKDTAGKLLFTGGEKLRIWAPDSMWGTIKEAFFVDTYAAGGKNTYYNYISEFATDPRLTDTAIWYLEVMPQATPERPFWHVYANAAPGKRYVRAQTNEQSSTYVDNRPGLHHIRMSAVESIIYGDWRLMYRCVFS